MTETDLRQQIVRALKCRWPSAWVYVPADRWRSGIPDILAVLPPQGRLIALEVKTPRGRLAPIQAATLAKIRRAGGGAWVIRSVEELQQVVLP